MQFLTDCEILEYCHGNSEERAASFQRAIDNQVKPIYQLPMFELCHALHILVKYHGVSPKDFRSCWADICKRHIESGEFFIHVSIEDPYKNFEIILSLSTQIPENITALCGDDDTCWGHNKQFVYRSKLVRIQEELRSTWDTIPPEGNQLAPSPEDRQSEDLVLDTNNLVDLLNELPEDGILTTAEIKLPDTLSENTRRKFMRIIKSYGSAGKFIVPSSALEEAHRIINYTSNLEKYNNVQKVLKAMLINDKPLWNIFDFKAIDQDVFDYFLLLYEKMESIGVDFSGFDDFADLIILAHGLHNGCKIASDEWIHVKPGAWKIIAPIYPFLVFGN
jgi:hypothetical protein